MEKLVNILAIIGCIFLALDIFKVGPNEALKYIGFFFWAVMDVVNAKIHKDKGERRNATIIAICAIVLFGVSVTGLLMPLLFQ